MKLQRRIRVAGQRLALAALVVGVPDDAALIQALDQHHPGRGPQLGIDGGQCHGIGLRQLGRDGFLQPLLKLLQGVGLRCVFVELGPLIAFAQVGNGGEAVGHALSIRIGNQAIGILHRQQAGQRLRLAQPPQACLSMRCSNSSWMPASRRQS